MGCQSGKAGPHVCFPGCAGVFAVMLLGVSFFGLTSDAAAQDNMGPTVTVRAVTQQVAEGQSVYFSFALSSKPAKSLYIRARWVTPSGSSEFAYVFNSPHDSVLTARFETENDLHSPGGFHEYRLIVLGHGSLGGGRRSPYVVGDPSSATVRVNDNDPPPLTGSVVSISGGDPVTEGGSAQFTLMASPPPAAAITVNVAVAEVGDFAAHGQIGSRTVIIGTDGSGSLSVSTENDNTDEVAGQITAVVNSGNDYTPHGTSNTASVAVNDNDPPPLTGSVVSISGGDPVTEGGSAQFTLMASPPPAAAITVNVAVAEVGDFAAHGQIGSRTVIIGTDGSGSLSVSTENDNTDEVAGQITAVVNSGNDYTPHGTSNTASVAVNDNDPPSPTGSVVSISGGDPVTEGGSAQFTLMASPPPDVSFVSESGQVDEGAGHAVMIRIHPVVAESLTLRYALSGTASPGQDYMIVNSGFVVVPSGTTSAIIDVRTREDNEHETNETLVLTLMDGDGYILGGTGSSDRTYTLTVVDDDARTPQAVSMSASLLRFGRTVTDQVLDRVFGRIESLDSGPLPGLAGRVAGTPVGTMDRSPVPANGDWTMVERNVSAKGLATGTGLTLTDRLEDGRMLGLWGGGVLGGYKGRDGMDDSVHVEGDVLSLQLGHDVSGTLPGGASETDRRWMAGVMVSRSSGNGNWLHGNTRGDVDNTLTALVPYGAVNVLEDLRLWGSLGWGTGEMNLKGNKTARDYTDWQMLAAGFRRNLDHLAVEPDGKAPLVRGLELSLNGDFRRTRVSSGRASGRVTRARLGLEGSVRRALSDGGTVRPSLELGLRHDGGGAETGFGVEVSGGVTWRDSRGLEMTVEGRMLAMHGDRNFRDHGVSASIARAPAFGTLSTQLALNIGDGMDSLLAGDILLSDSTEDTPEVGKWRAEAAYGLRMHRRSHLGSPYLELSGEDKLKGLRAGYRMVPGPAAGPGLEMDLYTRLDRSEGVDGRDDFGVWLEINWQW